jgi:putative oxidoreductase
MNTAIDTAPTPSRGATEFVERIIRRLDAVPYSLLAILPRLAVAQVFWSSGQTKLADWGATLQLFEEEYKVPLLPPDIAAHVAASIELSMPVLLVLGLFTRFAALVLLGMTTFIEVFVYPQAWPTHIQWAAMLVFLLFRGPGKLSLDELIARWFARRPVQAAST